MDSLWRSPEGLILRPLHVGLNEYRLVSLIAREVLVTPVPLHKPLTGPVYFGALCVNHRVARMLLTPAEVDDLDFLGVVALLDVVGAGEIGNVVERI